MTNQAPIRQSVAALARIARLPVENPGSDEYLFQWNDRWSCFSLPGGHKHPDESFHDCVCREIEEELGLVRGRDFHVAPDCAGQAEYTGWSRSAAAETRYTLELFDVTVQPGRPFDVIAADPRNRWLTVNEIQAGRTDDGQPVSDAARLFFPIPITIPSGVQP